MGYAGAAASLWTLLSRAWAAAGETDAAQAAAVAAVDVAERSQDIVAQRRARTQLAASASP